MSDTITLGKSRKDGKWQVLVQPERPFGEHLDAYRKIAAKHPVSEELSRVIIGKVNHSSPALTLISADQAAEKAKQDAARAESIKKIVASAEGRAKEKADEAAELKAMEHAEAIAEKNSIVEKVRKDTGQTSAQKSK